MEGHRATDDDAHAGDNEPLSALVGRLYRRVAPGFYLSFRTLLFATMAYSIHRPSSTRFILGWTSSELGHVFLLLQAWSLWSTRKSNPALLASPLGRVCTAIAAWSSYKFALSTMENFVHRDEMKQALAAGGIAQRAGANRVVQALAIVPLFAVARRGRTLKRTRDLEYADLKATDPELVRRLERTPSAIKLASVLSYRGHFDRWHTLDVITTDPPPPPGAPCLLYVHGGAWILGDKQYMAHTLLQRLASRGVVVFTINYRMAPEAAFPAALIDCKRALCWVKKHCHEFNGDAGKVFVSGESAGGHLSALVATSANFAAFQPPEHKDLDTSVAGGIPLSGVFDFTDKSGMNTLYPGPVTGMRATFLPFVERVVVQDRFSTNPELFHNASPLWYVEQRLAGAIAEPLCPFMVVHGNLDVLTSFEDSLRFFAAVKRLREQQSAGAKDVYVRMDKTHHAPGYFPSPRTLALADGMVDFILFHSAKRGGASAL